MAKYKIRRPGVAAGGLQIGNTGISASYLSFGSASCNVPQLTASGGVVSACFTISDVPAGARVFIQSRTACPGVIVTSTSAISACLVAASFASATAAATGGACVMWFQYLAIA